MVYKNCFQLLVDSVTADGLISGKLVAIDASAIDSYEKPIPKKNLVDDGSHANWGSKLDTRGNQHTWFGYKLHLAVDTLQVNCYCYPGYFSESK